MDNSQQQYRPLLNLSSEQIQIISAHALDAIQHMAAIEMDSKDLIKSGLQHAYLKGKLDLCQQLQTYDTDNLNAATLDQGE